jgi:hypothetical protein
MFTLKRSPGARCVRTENTITVLQHDPNAVAVDRVTLVHRVVSKDRWSVDPVTFGADVVGESVELHRTNNPHA